MPQQFGQHDTGHLVVFICCGPSELAKRMGLVAQQVHMRADAHAAKFGTEQAKE